MTRKILSSYALLFLFALSINASSLDESRLWLPVKYHPYYLDLKESALAAEKLEVCTEVLRGTLDREQSKPERPIYRILCRRPDGLSYNEMVDGLTKKTLTTIVRENTEPTEQELEEKRRISEQIKQGFRIACEEEFNRKTEFMINLTLQTAHDTEPVYFDEKTAIFITEFDAKGISGEKLKYRSQCEVGEGQPVRLSIKPRK
ncbi:hypothetical protein [Teredinibacter purpureus]|uniref:hypothetical protein n=1 Tax=Teredinibacter purpureus TaxID=2731756 RepID=UPI0005F7ACDA|nr:hypothetical protein [Teredinibacter purpureus]